MTIDEEIVFERKLADYYKDNHLKNEAKKHEQLAEWLEELKMLRELKEEHRKIGNIEGFNKGYNKALDDFVCVVKRRFPNDKNGIFHIEEIAEQLKEGE